MIITAGSKGIRVDYRLHGKTYSHQFPEGRSPENNATNSDYPFDSADVAPGQSITLPDDAEVVRTITLNDPSAPYVDPAL